MVPLVLKEEDILSAEAVADAVREAVRSVEVIDVRLGRQRESRRLVFVRA